MLLKSPRFAQRVDASLFSSGDAMGAVAGVQWLQRQRLPVLALAGTLTRSPLAQAEAEAATGLQALGLVQLADPVTARELYQRTIALRKGGAAA